MDSSPLMESAGSHQVQAKKMKSYKTMNTPNNNHEMGKMDEEEMETGEVTFVSNRNTAKYIKVDRCAEAECPDLCKKLWNKLKDMDIPRPKLAISITGGAKSFQISEQLEKAFKIGIRRALTTTDAWLITGGTSSGVMKLVAESLREYNETKKSREHIVALGMATFNTLVEKEQLQEGTQNAGGSDMKKIMYNSHGPDQEGKSYLDSSHNYFILVDGQDEKFGAEIELRAALEAYMAGNCKTPVVQIAVEGGPNTLETVLKTLEKDIPVMLIKDSGRATDALIKVREKLRNEGSIKPEDTCMQNPNFNDWTRSKISIIQEKQDLLSVYEFKADGSAKLDVAIFEALVSGKLSGQSGGHGEEEKLELALDWNMYEEVEAHLKYADSVPANGAKLMSKALKYNRKNFAELFRKSGIEITKLTLEELYSYENKFLQDVYRKYKKHVDTENPSYKNVGKLISHLLLDHVKDFYTQDSLIIDTTVVDTSLLSNMKRPFLHLMLWATLYNYPELAEYFWTDTVDTLAAALIGAAVSQKLAEQAQRLSNDRVRCTQLQLSKKFEMHACGIVQEGYENNKERVAKLLKRPLFYFIKNGGNNTPLSLADTAKLMDFMGHQACQFSLKTLWYGRIDDETSKLRLGFALICGPNLTGITITSGKHSDQSELSDQLHGHEAVARSMLLLDQTNDDHEETSNSSSRCEKLKAFYGAPVVKFSYYSVFYLIFLGVFSYFLMMDLGPVTHIRDIAISEWLVFSWAVSFVMEEIRQFAVTNGRTLIHKIKKYSYRPWNLIDLFSVLLYVVAVVLRFTMPPENFEWARSMYCGAYFIYFIRLLQAFYFSEKAGPKIIMIRKMMADLVFFISILLVFLVSWGVIAQALISPHSPNVANIFFMPYWQMFGELFLEELEAKCEKPIKRNSSEVTDPTSTQAPSGPGPDDVHCHEAGIIVIIFFAIYMLVVAVLLLNLLIAMFSYTFQSVQDNALKIWQFHRFELFYEYDDKPRLPPPFSIFGHICDLLMWIFGKLRECGKLQTENQNQEKDADKEKEENARLSKDGQIFFEDYLYKQSETLGQQELARE